MRALLFAGALLVGACGSERSDQPPAQEPVQLQRASADLVEHGRRVSDVLGCTGCHGADLKGTDWSEPGFGRLWTANLTHSVPRYTDAQLDQVIRGGARPDRELWEMPSHLFTQLTVDDMSALIAFLRAKPPAGEVRPEPLFEAQARREIAAGTFSSSRAQVQKMGGVWPPAVGPEHALGRYIVRATCAECHGLDLRGGQPHPQAKPRPDLRMVAGYQPEQFKTLLRTGIAAGGRDVTLMSEVARGRYKQLTDAEVGAIYRYLQAVAEAAP